MVLRGVWPLSKNTIGIKTIDFVLLEETSGDGMQMLSVEGGTT